MEVLSAIKYLKKHLKPALYIAFFLNGTILSAQEKEPKSSVGLRESFFVSDNISALNKNRKRRSDFLYFEIGQKPLHPYFGFGHLCFSETDHPSSSVIKETQRNSLMMSGGASYRFLLMDKLEVNIYVAPTLLVDVRFTESTNTNGFVSEEELPNQAYFGLANGFELSVPRVKVSPTIGYSSFLIPISGRPRASFWQSISLGVKFKL